MRHPSLRHCVPAFFVAAFFCSALFAADSTYPAFAKRLGGPVLEARPEALLAAVRNQIQAEPKSAPRLVHLVLASGRGDVYKIAPQVVEIAILALDKNATPQEIGAIVTAAVKAVPEEAPAIVRIAVETAPGKKNAQAIVAAALASVPNKNELVRLHEKKIRDGKDGKSAPDAEELPIAQAIVKAAIEADPSLDPATLAASIGGPTPADPYDISKIDLVSRLPTGVAGPGGLPMPTPAIRRPVSP